MSSPILLVPLFAVFVALALASASAIALGARIRPLARLFARVKSPPLRAALVLAPAALGVLGFAALLSPNPFGGCHCALHGLHHPHLCVAHPAFALPLVAPAACILGAWALLVAPRAWRLARELFDAERWARAARDRASLLIDGVRVRLTDGLTRSAFTIGALAPIIVIDRALWDALSEEERRAVVHHEQAHVERRDGLTLAVLRLSAALLPILPEARLIAAWKAAAELSCDEYAARKIGDRAAVAAALVAASRAQARFPGTEPPAFGRAALGVGDGGDLTARVMALLDADPSREPGPLPGNDVLAVALVSLGVALLTLVWPGDLFHHTVETLIGLVVHHH